MDRRGFLKGLTAVVGGIALNEAVPLGRVWSFPKEIKIAEPCMIRLIRAYDPLNDKMIIRLDMAYGFGHLHLPSAIEFGSSWSGRNAEKNVIERYPRLEPHLRVLEGPLRRKSDRCPVIPVSALALRSLSPANLTGNQNLRLI